MDTPQQSNGQVTRRYIASGRVHPERASVYLETVPLRSPNGDTTVYCAASQLTVIVERSDIDGYYTAYNYAEHCAEIVVGALGFSLGCGYSVEIVQVIEEDGQSRVFGVQPKGTRPDETLRFTPHEGVFTGAFRLSLSDLFFRLALRDYLRALTETTDCAAYCYRAIEAVERSFASSSGKGDGWTAMHGALGTDKATIESVVKDFADPVRHGNWIEAKPTNRHQRWQMLTLTRDVLSKYLELKTPRPQTTAVTP